MLSFALALIVPLKERSASRVISSTGVLKQKMRGWTSRSLQPSGCDKTIFFGLPILVKDANPVRGVPLTFGGSPLYDNYVPRASDLMVEATLEENGAVVIGMTNCPELVAGANTFNDRHGATRNPYDTRLSAGGSSGGSAAALASAKRGSLLALTWAARCASLHRFAM